jgi:hypothetical protein
VQARGLKIYPQSVLGTVSAIAVYPDTVLKNESGSEVPASAAGHPDLSVGESSARCSTMSVPLTESTYETDHPEGDEDTGR